jgi:hypothetical protein
MPATFDGPNLVITLPSGVTDIDVQVDLYSDWKEWYKTGDNAKYPIAFTTSGGDPLTPGVTAGAYYFLQNQHGWRIRPPEEDITIFLDGNLAPADTDDPMFTITIGNFNTQIIGLQPITQSVSTLLTESRQNVEKLQYLVESLRDDHTATGNVWYWDPENGLDTNDGTTVAKAVKTFPVAHALAVDWGHDVIVAIPGNMSNTTVYTDPVSITKNWVFLRGPGSDFVIQPTTVNGNNAIVSLEGSVGSEVTGFSIDGSDVIAGNGHSVAFKLSSHDVRLTNLRITNIAGDGNTTGHAISTANCHENIVENVYMENIAGTGLRLDDCSHFVCKNITMDTIDKGFYATASTPGSGGEADLNNIYVFNANVGIQVDTNVKDTIIRSSVNFSNVKTHLIDNGDGTAIEDILQHIHGGNVQASTNNTIQLDVNASAVDGTYDPAIVQITAGPGIGQLRYILDYKGATKIATVDRNWKVLPTSNSEFQIIPTGGRPHVNEGLAQAGSNTTITLNTNASDDDNAYIGQTIFIRAGTGEDQARRVTVYDGTTKIASVDRDWDVVPNTTSAYVMLPTSLITPEDIAWATSGAIFIDSVSGSDTNDGRKPYTPVQTAAAAKILADLYNIKQYNFKGSITLTSEHDRWSFIGASASFNDILNLGNQSVDESRFQGCQISGDAVESNIEALFCELDNPGNLHGVFRQCGFLNTFKVESVVPETYVFHHCYSQVAGSGRPTLDFTSVGVTHNVQLRNYVGGINVANMIQGNLSIDTPGGTVDLKSTVTGGDIVVRGTGIFIDNSGASVTVTEGFIDGLDFRLIKQVTAGKAVVSPDDQTITIYDEDDTTVLATYNVSVDTRTRTRTS